ncbi:MAG: allophanate hydrolase [Gordonia sp. (in: high G+C Gram-positive bacteria)]
MSRIADVYARIAASGRDEVFVTLRPEADVAAEYAAATGPLAGLVLAVKDNVDAAGLPTTAACPGYAYIAKADAAAVAALRAAGATVIGKTNLDQFATGLVGTRSPYGAVRDSRRAEFVSGGSSSGSAVAVALGFADLAIGTDTAGSGRVPAGLQGIVGIKPTVGVVSTDGVVPACASYDCVTVFAADLALAERAMAVMAAPASAREWPSDTKFAAPPAPRIAVPAALPNTDSRWSAAFDDAVVRVRESGAEVVAVDFADFFAAAELLYGGALVAERYDAVGEFVSAAGPDTGLDPTVTSIIEGGKDVRAVDLLRDRRRVAELKARAMASVEGFDALMVPTAPRHPTLAEVAADPIGVNSELGTFTNFCNLFDLCAVAVPAGAVDEGEAGVAQFGVTLLGRAFDDAVVADLARRLAPGAEAAGPSWPEAAGAQALRLAVFGAHLPGQPLQWQLTDRGARWDGDVATAPRYRLFRLDTQPPKPGLVPVEGSKGHSIAGGVWTLSPAALGAFLAALPAPMTLGEIELDDGSLVTGFGCGEDAPRAEDITDHGGWLAALARP